ncbi:MAG: class I SAM-dependent methyltransferase [Proteobacteria bacterium]|nr:class I SAM-dependent methyltransferase [Pseudomonadota bacterium]
MINSLFRRAACAILLGLVSTHASAQDDNFTPFVISGEEVVLRMLRMADVGPGDFLIDLGSGDGRIPIMAAKRFGARGLGVDLDPPLVDLARRNAARDGVADKVAFEVKDLFDTDLSKASVVAFYLLPDVAMQLRPKLLKELRPGTRIVAHDYNLGGWPADEWTSIRVPDKPVAPVGISQVFLWVVPADARGRWTSEIGGRRITFDIEQNFQLLKARISADGPPDGDGPPLQLRAAGLRGEQVSLVVAGRLGGKDGIHHLGGRIIGNRIEGEIVTGTRAPERMAWKAERQ